MSGLCEEPAAILAAHIFNSRDHAETGTVFLHYTDLWTQPWVSPFRPESIYWLNEHLKLMKSDPRYLKLVQEGVAMSYYRPGILQTNRGLKWSDLCFLPPQLKVYASRRRFLRLMPDFLLGGLAQIIAFLRSISKNRTT